MELKKVIKKYGNSLVISFSKEERLTYNLKEGDMVLVIIK